VGFLVWGLSLGNSNISASFYLLFHLCQINTRATSIYIQINLINKHHRSKFAAKKLTNTMYNANSRVVFNYCIINIEILSRQTNSKSLSVERINRCVSETTSISFI